MKTITFGIIIIIYVCSYNIAAAAGFGEVCNDTVTCTETGQECNGTCACYTNNNYNYDGSKCVKELGRGCTTTSECNDAPAVICDTVCKCNTTTHYDDDGDATGGSCTERHGLGVICPNPISEAGDDLCSTPNAVCKAVTGSSPATYTCQCSDGFSQAGSTCVAAANKCDSGPCQNGGTCTGETSTYSCSCTAGFTGTNCETDIDECTQNTDNCNANADCTDTDGSYQCTCKTGYTGNGFSCTDIDECTQNTDNCNENADCTDTDGSFQCTCKTGYTGNGFSCTDIDECTQNTDNCNANADCTDTDGSYQCTCKTGYTGNGFSCTDIDECTQNTDNCNANADCTDTDGSYQCTCKTGYTGNGFSCTDIDECTQNTDNCNANADCTDTDGSYQCTCKTGYTGNGFSCTDIDECTQNTDNCNANADCTDTDGSYQCTCKTGYTGNGFSCTDIDECTQNTDNCNANADCTDTDGSYQCTCKTGYTGNGFSCTDIDECTQNTDNCNANADCTDTDGSYQCTCKTGYTGNGFSCTDINDCFPNPCLNGGTCTDGLNDFTCACNNRYSSKTCDKAALGASCSVQGTTCEKANAFCDTGSICLCRSSYYDNDGTNNIGGTCTQKVELGSTGCSTFVTNSCKSPNAQCQTNGGYCTCNSGYYDSNGGAGGGTCTQKVKLGSTGCSTTVTNSCKSPNAQCQTNGGYCTCNSGYYDSNGGAGGGTCTQKIELGQTGCSRSVTDSCKDGDAECLVNGGTCTCKTGYYDDNGSTSKGTCRKKIELGQTGCSRSVTDSCKDGDAECLVNGGTCTCKTGYYDDNGSTSKGTCRKKKELGESGCSTLVANSCNDVKSRCYTNGGYCLCIPGYFDSNGDDARGTCESNKGLGKPCTGQSNECSDSAAQCLDDKCTCGFNYYDSNGFTDGGNCLSVSELQVLAINFPSDSIGTSQFTVSWTPPTADRLSQISSYGVDWKLKTSDNSLVGGNKEVSRTATSTMINTGITSGKTYIVTVTSKNAWTQSNVPRTTSLSKEQAAKPDIPRSLTTPDLNANDRTLTIGWSAPASGVASGYTVRLLDGTSEITSVERSSSPVSISNSNIKNGYRYNIEIKARSEAYDGTNYVWSDKYEVQIKTVVQVPSAPKSVQCDTIKDESIALTWSAPEFPNGDLVKYIIQVLNANQQLQFNTSTSQVVESHTVISLSPGTTYMFRVFTENEMYTSTSYGQSAFCMTKAKLSEPPTDLKTVAVSSRNFTVSWNKPLNTYSEEIYGYVIQLKNGDECVKEVVYNCSNCLGTFQASGLENMCASTVRDVISKTETELSGLQSYHFINLLPDTTYTISGTAVNNLGRGNVATISQTTAEEAPQTPYNVEVRSIGTTSFTVLWSIDGPRPGQTNFTVTLTADRPAPIKEMTFTGFNTRDYTAEGLEEYWNYSVTVTATTSVGAKTSDITQEYRTIPAAPGQVSNFKLTTAPGGNYTRMKITWNAPALLERNSIIKEYSFLYYSSPELKSGSPEIFQHQSLESHEYEIIVNVEPEVSYTFEVYATNDENMTGETKTEILEAPAGVPINIEEKLGVDIIPANQVKDQQQETFTLTLVQEFFLERTYGVPQATGLVGCAKNCQFPDIKTLDNFNSMDDWKTASPKGFPMWRITKKSLDWFRKNNANSRRKRSTTQLDYTVGSEDCSQVPDEDYCNGPLQPGTSYTIVAVSCTNGGCLVSKEYGPFITLAVPDETDNVPMIIGIVIAVVVVVVVGAVVGFILLRRRRRSPSKMKHVSESDDDEFTTVDPAVAKIQRKRPVLLSEIEEYVTTMHKDSNLLFSAEYEELKTLSPKHTCEAADREENRMRNRYINIIPFDHTRVKLNTNGEDDSSDYINANYLPGYSSPREYIGCQGPIPGTIDDFWRMTWEQNVSVIVMLTLCKEGQKIKCEQYWPDEVGEPKQYGDVIVEITSYSNIRTYDYRMFKITNGNTTRVVKHFHFLSWLDFQANVHHDIILDFIQHVRQHVQPPDTSGPMIIHCSAGVGRTGTYIALEHLMQFINEHDFEVEIDIFDLVLKLRENRQHMVQTEQQYVFIHDCVKEIMDRKRRQMENIYENQAFSAQDENIYQNEQSLYANVAMGKSEQNTEL